MLSLFQLENLTNAYFTVNMFSVNIVKLSSPEMERQHKSNMVQQTEKL